VSGFARIWNLGSDLNAWTAGGTDAKPLIEWSASDLDGDGVTITVRIYKASTGTKDDASRVYIASGLANTGSHQANWGMKNDGQSDAGDGHGPVAYATVEAVDQYGESSGESARVPFKVEWGQAVYEYNVGVGAGSLQFSNSNVPAGTSAAFLFRNAGAAGATPSAWASSIGAIPTSQAYVNILVRLSTYTSPTQPALPDMTLTYQTSAAVPDNWALSPTGHWALDLDVRRYGDKCVKCIVSTAAYHYVEPYRVSAADGIPVSPNTDYVFSAFVKTNGPLTAGHVVRLEVRDFATFGDEKHGTTAGDEYADGPGATADTSVDVAGGHDPLKALLYPEGWQRIHVHYRTGPSETLVRPTVMYTMADGTTPSNNGDVFWVDAAKWEEGTVVSAWTPGFISPAMVLDSYGLLADASLGGKVSLKASGGLTATIDQLVDAAQDAQHIRTGTGAPNSAVTGNVGDIYLRTDGGATTTLYVKESGAGTNTGWVAK
jgi:hypothetical protein